MLHGTVAVERGVAVEEGMTEHRSTGEEVCDGGDMTEPQYRYALRLYTHDGYGTNSLLCDLGLAKYGCPQWYHETEYRITWGTAKEARDYLDVLRARWPIFQRPDIRVVRVVPPVGERFVEVGWLTEEDQVEGMRLLGRLTGDEPQ